jgi:hypothetical protein
VEEVAMNDQAFLAILAAIALAFEFHAVQNLAPAIWGVSDGIIASLCTGVDLNTGCYPVEAVASR